MAIDESEKMLSRYFDDYVSSGKPGISHVLRTPHHSFSALIALYRQPLIRATLTDTVEGVAIREYMTRRSSLGRTVVHSATSLLVLPENPIDYSLGAARQTLRRKARKALKSGVHWKEVDDAEERQTLVNLARESEQNHPLEDYRESTPDNTDLLNYGLWLVAYSQDDCPLLLSVTPIDGEWALLRYFRTLGGGGDEHSNARYLMTQVLVERLIKAGVRYLADMSSPVGLPNGLRHFQRMLGFRIVRVVIEKDRAAEPQLVRRVMQRISSMRS